MTGRTGPVVLAIVALLIGVTSCSSSSVPAPGSWHPLSVRLPPSLAGFEVRPEPSTAGDLHAAGGRRSLIDGAAVFSLRQGGQLYGVLEITELLPNLDAGSADFQKDVVGQIGQSPAHPLRVRGQTVYQGTAPNQQVIYSWFNDHRMDVLLTRGIRDARSLLEAVLRSLQ